MMERAVRGDAASMLSSDQPLTRCEIQQPTRRDGACHGSGQFEGYLSVTRGLRLQRRSSQTAVTFQSYDMLPWVYNWLDYARACLSLCG